MSDIPQHHVFPPAEEIFVETSAQGSWGMSQTQETGTASQNVQGIEHRVLESYILMSRATWLDPSEETCPWSAEPVGVAYRPVSYEEILLGHIACEHNISKEGCRKAKDYARDLLYDALRTADFTVEEFERKLESDNMYPACGVRRLKKSRGRPKTKGGDSA